jgi:hypothetical protein
LESIVSAKPKPSLADVPSFADENFLVKAAEIIERLASQSELGGHHLLASILAIAKEEAEDDLRTRRGKFQRRGLSSEVDGSLLLMAQRFACGDRTRAEFERSTGFARLLSFAARDRQSALSSE